MSRLTLPSCKTQTNQLNSVCTYRRATKFIPTSEGELIDDGILGALRRPTQRDEYNNKDMLETSKLMRDLEHVEHSFGP